MGQAVILGQGVGVDLHCPVLLPTIPSHLPPAS